MTEPPQHVPTPPLQEGVDDAKRQRGCMYVLLCLSGQPAEQRLTSASPTVGKRPAQILIGTIADLT